MISYRSLLYNTTVLYDYMKLLIQEVHENLVHAGLSHTLSCLRH